MTVQELMALLEDIPGDVEIRIMMQESWPFECRIDGIALASEMTEEEKYNRGMVHDDDESEVEEVVGYQPKGMTAGEECVYIVEGAQIGYGSKLAWQVYRRH